MAHFASTAPRPEEDEAVSDQPLEDQVQHRVENRVSWITLNRPEVRNAITHDQRERVIELLDDGERPGRDRRGGAHRHRRRVLHRGGPARRAPSRTAAPRGGSRPDHGRRRRG